MAHGPLFPGPGIELISPALEPRSPNNWATRKFSPNFHKGAEWRKNISRGRKGWYQWMICHFHVTIYIVKLSKSISSIFFAVSCLTTLLKERSFYSYSPDKKTKDQRANMTLLLLLTPWLFFKTILLFHFGCAGSSLLCAGSL